jgi:uncharacterized surface protein with fasciclin (FAS1) repeats
MKNLKFKSIGRRITFQVAVLASLSFVAMSCDDEEMASMDQTVATETSIMNVLKAAPAKPNAAPGSSSIAEIAIGAGFSELVSALAFVDEELNAGLVDLFLNGKDQYTVFAPTDDAFSALYGALGIDSITELPAELVLNVLLYHVTEGRRIAKSVVPPKNMRKIETLLGETFSVTSGGEIKAIGNTANIAAADISASNGIIHIIDAVILPIK